MYAQNSEERKMLKENNKVWQQHWEPTAVWANNMASEQQHKTPTAWANNLTI